MSENPLDLTLIPKSAPVKKAPWRSKTLLTNALSGLLLLYPPTRDFVQEYPSAAVAVVLVVNFLLRLITHGKISLDE